MNQKDFQKIVEKQLKRSADLLVVKGKEYDTNECDRLKSFKVAGNLIGETQTEALAGMMAKHTVSVYDMCKSPNKYNLDKWNEKITDSINYLLILRAMVVEERLNLLTALRNRERDQGNFEEAHDYELEIEELIKKEGI